ncbi:MAG: enoyl-CoA hydratase-related protein [Spirochaetes bacterium]|nr:enoyl-CoA hydratase-related protein [Spirochaetota bacterium]
MSGVIYEKKGPIAVITINRPEVMNSLDVETNMELKKTWFEFRDDDSLKVAILTGAGDRAFSAGADLARWAPYYAKLTPAEKRRLSEEEVGFGVITRNFVCWKPIIAAINGICIAGGTEMALASDLKIASEDSTFGLSEVRWAIIPGAGGTQRLPRNIPLCKAMEMILMAKTIKAPEALELGLINKVVPRDQVMSTAVEWAERICQMGPLAIRAAKMCVMQGLDKTLEDGLKLEASYAEYIIGTEDAVEGPMAFVEKRKPNFKAR